MAAPAYLQAWGAHAQAGAAGALAAWRPREAPCTPRPSLATNVWILARSAAGHHDVREPPEKKWALSS